MPGPEEWPSCGSNAADRIRLTGPAATTTQLIVSKWLIDSCSIECPLFQGTLLGDESTHARSGFARFDIALSSRFNLEDRLARVLVVNDV